ncbi:MAG TPA: hypothetical protein VGP79_07100 [Bryobacteraceae bacterium]|jgi:hypothetical protein|nr:hypothetical protein [Bryobacteraceae bacterium]
MSKSSPILARIVAQTGIPDLYDRLARLSPSDLNSLLLEIFRARRHSPADLIRGAAGGTKFQWSGSTWDTSTSLTSPCAIDARVLHEFDRAALETAAEFTALDLSPVDPLGLQRTLGGIDQNNVLSALRGVEVSGDPTSALALEAARRRKRGQSAVNLCASQRVLRLQPFDVPGFSPHFRLFALATAARDSGSFSFEADALSRHLRFYLNLFRTLNARGFALKCPVVEFSDTRLIHQLLESKGISWDEVRRHAHAHQPGAAERFLAERGVELPTTTSDPQSDDLALINTRLFPQLRREYPEAEFRFNLSRLEGAGYYAGVCLRISPQAPDGNRYPIVDGGMTDWTARLLQNRKERFLATGIGSQFACLRYHVSSH